MTTGADLAREYGWDADDMLSLLEHVRDITRSVLDVAAHNKRARPPNRPVRRAHLLVILAFEAGVVSLTEACSALHCTAKEMIDLESDLIGEGRELARELECPGVE